MGVSIDDLPEPLRHAVLPRPVLLFAVLLSLLLLAAILQRIAPQPGLRLSGGPLAGLAFAAGTGRDPVAAQPALAADGVAWRDVGGALVPAAGSR